MKTWYSAIPRGRSSLTETGTEGMCQKDCVVPQPGLKGHGMDSGAGWCMSACPGGAPGWDFVHTPQASVGNQERGSQGGGNSQGGLEV